MASKKYKITRLKIQNINDGVHSVKLYKHKNDKIQELCTKTVVVRNFCKGKSIYLKYLSNDGRYKFISFCKYSINNHSGESLGSISRLTTDLYSGKSSSEQIGYDKSSSITATVTNVGFDEFKEISDVVTSSKVYMQVNENSDSINDSEENWILVTVDGNMQYNTKNPSQNFILNINLPKQYTITL